SLLNVDTTNSGNLTIGNATSPTTITFVGGATASRPVSPTKGQLYYDTSTNSLIQYNGSKWVSAPRSATLIIAASNSSQAEKDAADYIATGTADQTVINNAISALPSSGGTVYLTEGTYYIAGNISLGSNIKLIGAGPSTILMRVNSSSSFNLLTTAGGSSNITIEDFTVDGNKANNTNTNNNIEFFNTTNGVADNIISQNATGNGFLIGSFSTITNSTLQNNNSAGIYTFSNATSNFTISNNRILNNGTGISTVASASAAYAVITGNTINSNAGVGIVASSYEQITSNTINLSGSSATQAITIDGYSNTAIANNTINDASSSAYTIEISNGSNNSVIGNSINGLKPLGIITFYGNPVNTYISNNTLSGATTPITDQGTGTIYVNQQDGSGNLINKSQGGGFVVGASSATASLSIQGGETINQLSAPSLSSGVTNVGTAGTTTYRYQVTALDGIGETTGSTIQQTTTGYSTLSTSNYNTITWAPIGGAVQYNIYRCTGASCTPLKIASVIGNVSSYNDQSAGTPSGGVPTINTTGGLTVATSIQGTTAIFSGSSALTVGSTTNTGVLILQDGTSNNRTISLISPALSSSYSLTLPTVGVAGTSCLQSTSGSTTSATLLQWGSCGSGGGSYINNNSASLTTEQTSANFFIQGAASSVTAKIQGASGQDITDFYTSAGTSAAALAVTSAGGLTFGQASTIGTTQVTSGVGNSLSIVAGQGASGSAGGNLYLKAGANGTASGTPGSVIVQANGGNSSTAFQVQNANGATLLATDSTSNKLVINGNLNLVGVTAPATAPTLNSYIASGALTGTYYYVVTYITPAGQSSDSPASAAITPSAQNVILNIPTSANSLVTARKIYRGTSSTGNWYLVGTVNDNTTTTFTDSNTSPGVEYVNLDSSTGIYINGNRQYSSDATGNMLLGYGALSNFAGGYGNEALGNAALQSAVNDNENTAIGSLALQTDNGGDGNTATGYNALQANTTGSNNSSFGDQSLHSNQTGSQNTGVGTNALGQTTTGSNNTALGYHAFYDNTTGSNNIAIGYRAGEYDSNSNIVSGSNLQNATAIGSYAQVQASNTLVLGSVDTATQIVVGATEGISTNLFGVSPVVDDSTSTGCSVSSTASTTCLTSGTSQYFYDASGFGANAAAGDIFIGKDAQQATITAITSSNWLTFSAAINYEATGTYFRLHKPGFQIANNGNVYTQNTSTTALQIQNTAGQTMLGVDTSSGKVNVGSNSGINGLLVINSSATSGSVGLTVSSTTFTSYTLTLPNAAPTASGQCLQSSATFTTLTWSSCGSGGGGSHTKKINLTAEYAGSVLTNCTISGAGACAGTDTNNGTMTSSWDNSTTDGGPGYMSYYNWTSTATSAQTYDIMARVPIPSDWSSWTGTNMTLYYYDDSNTNTALSVQVAGYNGTTNTYDVGSSGTMSSVTLGTASSWNSATFSLTNADYAADGYATIRIRVTASNSSNIRIGNLVLNYTSAY
ncbi:MAG TPA: right-handed parallel beta-helix repeat-containing protein, partial [Candidatus Saccharimonadales bacterium]|nr:right-handed parallel beta-helix repeat-containing protein [Candidatus Saccharimonadales bacterium]